MTYTKGTCQFYKQISATQALEVVIIDPLFDLKPTYKIQIVHISLMYDNTELCDRKQFNRAFSKAMQKLVNLTEGGEPNLNPECEGTKASSSS